MCGLLDGQDDEIMKIIREIENSYSKEEITSKVKSIYRSFNVYEDGHSLRRKIGNEFDLSQLGQKDISGLSARRLLNFLVFRYYKNEAYVKYLLSSHWFGKNDTVCFFELPVNHSRLDFCRIDGHSYAYEIKTVYDNYSRLSGQLDDYYSLFEFVFVAVPDERVTDILKMVPEETGVVSYGERSGKHGVSTCRKPLYNDRISPHSQLNILTLAQLRRLDPDINTENRQKKIGEMVISHSEAFINEFFMVSLKRKYEKRWKHLNEIHGKIFPLDYQVFFNSTLPPELVYS